MRSRAVILSALMILSVLASPLAGLGAAGPPDHVGVPSDKVEIVGSDSSPAAAQSTGGGPSNNAAGGPSNGGGPPAHAGPPNGLPDAVPDHAAAWSVGADKHADNLSVSIGTDEDGRLMMTLTDDVNPDGREISIDRETLTTATGSEPERVFGEHESGESWTSSISYSGEKATFRVPHFSTNNVTFSGGIVIGETFSDGSQAAYDLVDPESAGDISLDLTGKESTEWDNVSASGVGVDHTTSLSAGGNLEPTDGDGGDPTLSVTGHVSDGVHDPQQVLGDGTTDTTRDFLGDTGSDTTFDIEFQVQPQVTGNLQNISVTPEGTSGSDYGMTVDVYIIQEPYDQTIAEGTKVATWDPDWSTSTQTFTTDAYSIEAGKTYTIGMVTSGSDNDGTDDQLTMGFDDGGGDLSYSTKEGHEGIPTVTVGVKAAVNNLDVIDGAGHSHTFGDFTDGETKTASLNLDTSSTSLDFTGTGGGTIDYTLTMQERTETTDPGVELNGEQVASVDGTLPEGTTESFTIDSSHLVEGENRLNVSMADLSADAPAPLVGLDYEHNASAVSASTTVSASTWEEQVNTSHVFPSSQSYATANIPFSPTTASIHEVEISVNGSAYEPVDETNLDWDGDRSDLEVYLGDVSEGTEIALRATGRKVQVTTGSIEITEPTIEGDKLSTGIEVTGTDAEGVSIDVTGTDPDPRIHYLSETSWSAEEYVERDSAQVLRIPDAHVGATATVATAPIEVSPGTGGVEVEILDVSEPRFDLREGNMSGADEVTVTYHDTLSGERYVLKNLDRNLTVDDAVAESPVEFVTSYLGTYTIAQEDEDKDVGVAVTAASGASGLLPIFGGVAGSLVLFAIVGRYLGSGSWASRSLLGIGAIVVGYVAAEIVTAESLTTSLTYGLSDTVGAFASSGAGVVAIGVGLLVAVWLLDELLPWSIPFPILAIALGLVVLWTIEQIAPGSLSSGLEEIGPVVWLGLIGGGGFLIYRWIGAQQTEVVIEGLRR